MKIQGPCQGPDIYSLSMLLVLILLKAIPIVLKRAQSYISLFQIHLFFAGVKCNKFLQVLFAIKYLKLPWISSHDIGTSQGGGGILLFSQILSNYCNFFSISVLCGWFRLRPFHSGVYQMAVVYFFKCPCLLAQLHVSFQMAFLFLSYHDDHDNPTDNEKCFIFEMVSVELGLAIIRRV